MFLYLLQDEPGCEEINCSEGECENLPSIFPVAITEQKSAIETCNSFRNIWALWELPYLFRVIVGILPAASSYCLEGNAKISIAHGEIILTTNWGITKKNIQIKELLWFFHQMSYWLRFQPRNINGYYHLPSTTRPTWGLLLSSCMEDHFVVEFPVCGGEVGPLSMLADLGHWHSFSAPL